MAKTILIPIDFSVASLNTLKIAMESKQDDADVILMYAELPSDSITDLLFYSRDRIIGARITPDFMEALEVIKNRFQRTIQDIEIALFHGSNLSALETFLELNAVNEIFIPKTYKLHTPKLAFDPLPLLKKSSVPVTEIAWENHGYTTEKDQLQSLFVWAKQSHVQTGS